MSISKFSPREVLLSDGKPVDASNIHVFSINVSLGELIDRLTILEVKISRIQGKSNQKFLRDEISHLSKQVPASVGEVTIAELRKINEAIFDWMEKYYTTEMETEELLVFLQETIRLNILRSERKRAIDFSAGSAVREVKSYFGPS